jgi:hypothetical protein
MSANDRILHGGDIALVDVVDRLLGHGAMVTGDVTLSIAGVDLVYVGLRAILGSISTIEPPGAEHTDHHAVELEPPVLDPPPAPARRLDTDDPHHAERGLAQLVMVVVELLRQLMERQALRRVESGGLDDETIERLGATLMALEARMEQLKEVFGLDDDDLNLDLGPLGRLL